MSRGCVNSEQPHLLALGALFLCVGVCVGVFASGVLYESFRGSHDGLRALSENDTARSLEASGNGDARPVPGGLFDGIHGLLREWRCGAGNMQTPRLIGAGGFGQIVVDIGLGMEAKETLDAVKNGFIVIAFEPMPENIASIRHACHAEGLSSRVRFVSLRRNERGHWRVPSLEKPSTSFAYILHAGVSDVDSSTHLAVRGTGGAMGSMVRDRVRNKTSDIEYQEVPLVRLDTALPSWAKQIHLLKIDTQGYELRVLNGARRSLSANRFRYVLYEFSPWLMVRGDLGDPRELLQVMPSMGALCFDMMGLHNMFPHRQRPLGAYYDDLLRGQNSYMYTNQLPSDGKVPEGAHLVGPWDDIMCWFPHAGERLTPLVESGAFGYMKYNETGSFGRNYLRSHHR